MLELAPSLLYTADAMTRVDLSLCTILDERAYVAAMMARARDLWKLAGGQGLLMAKQPTASEEQKTGIDLIIGIKVDQTYKLIGLEAKRPGFKTARKWDELKPRERKSRFSRQILSQKSLVKAGWVTGAIFIDERRHYDATGLKGDTLGCSYVPWQLLAMVAIKKSRASAPSAWQTTDLPSLLSWNPSQPTTLEWILREVIQCRCGIPVTRKEALESAATFAEHTRLFESGEFSDQQLINGSETAESDVLLLTEIMSHTGAYSALLLEPSSGGLDEALRAKWRETSGAWNQIDRKNTQRGRP